jgi:hypothetical protein
MYFHYEKRRSINAVPILVKLNLPSHYRMHINYLAIDSDTVTAICTSSVLPCTRDETKTMNAQNYAIPNLRQFLFKFNTISLAFAQNCAGIYVGCKVIFKDYGCRENSIFSHLCVVYGT